MRGNPKNKEFNRFSRIKNIKGTIKIKSCI